MTAFCPHCERDREVVIATRSFEYIVRGDPIQVEVPIAHCTHCGNEFEAPDSDVDPIELAYEQYRDRHGLLHPSDIREFRHSLGLTQKELSTLLGWGAVTLARYENGALQDDAHDGALRLAMEPQSLLRLLDDRPDSLSPSKRRLLATSLRDRITRQGTFLMHFFEDVASSLDPDEFTGYRRFDIDKLYNSILFFCSGGEVFKTKLNKLLFYADFKHCKDYSVSISGSRYAHLPFGPAPDNYAFIVAALADVQGALVIDERAIGEYVGEVLTAIKPPDLAVFDPSELKILAMVNEEFAGRTAKQVSDLSHKEDGFLNTQNGELISYSYATTLSL